jgi:hypothetical protein
MRATMYKEILLNFLLTEYAFLAIENSAVGRSIVAVGDGKGVLGLEVFVATVTTSPHT